MQYYELLFDYENDEKYLLAEPRIDAEDEYIVCDGKVITEWKPFEFECDLENGHVITDNLGNSYGWEIYSEKALELFGDIIDNDVQLLPTKVFKKGTEQEIAKYFVVNVLPFLDAIDLENSVYKYHGDGDSNRLSVIKYAIKRDRVGHHNIFRLRDSQFAVFVSETIKKVAEDNKMLGFDFLKVKTT